MASCVGTAVVCMMAALLVGLGGTEACRSGRGRGWVLRHQYAVPQFERETVWARKIERGSQPSPLFGAASSIVAFPGLHTRPGATVRGLATPPTLP